MIFVAAFDSSDEDKARAGEYVVASASDDAAEVIQAAIDTVSGKVYLAKGTYGNCQKRDSRPGAILLPYSGAELCGDRGAVIRLADGQNCDLIATEGAVERVRISDIEVDANADGNPGTGGESWQNINGIRLGRTGETCNFGTVERVLIRKATGLGIVTVGDHPRILNNEFRGGSGHDNLELATGYGGKVRDNIHIIGFGESAPHVSGLDNHDGATFDGEQITVHAGGSVSNGVHRIIGNGDRSTFVNGRVVVHPGGDCLKVFLGTSSAPPTLRGAGYNLIIKGYQISALGANYLTTVRLNAGTLFQGNSCFRVSLAVTNTDTVPIRVNGNMFRQCVLATAGVGGLVYSDNEVCQ